MGNSKSVRGLHRVFTNSNLYNLYHKMIAKYSKWSGFVVYVSTFIVLQFYFVKGKNNNNRLHYLVFQNNLICNIFTVNKYNLIKDRYSHTKCLIEHLSWVSLLCDTLMAHALQASFLILFQFVYYVVFLK